VALDRVTITGADDSTDPLEILDLALAYPWLEFGILASASREGSPRYPSRAWQQILLKSAHRMNLSMHVCGKWARELFSGDLEWVELPPIKTMVQRIQINGDPPYGAGNVEQINERRSLLYGDRYGPGVQFIMQYPRAGNYLARCQCYSVNCVPLFDESGGAGSTRREWTDLPLDYVGYAGGIGPDNVTDLVRQIGEMRSRRFWIDMESGVRDREDRFDMRKVERVIDICEGIMNRPAFDEIVARAEQKAAGRKKV
jgi:hypothetical protein